MLRLRDRLAPTMMIGLLACAVPAVTVWAFGQTKVSIPANVHFYGVGMTAIAAAAAAVVLTTMGTRFQDTRTVLIGTAFAVMAALLALHGIATPGVLFSKEPYGVVVITGGATLPAGAAILALSVFELPPFLRGVRPLLILQAVLLVGILAMGVTALAEPSWLPEVPEAKSPPALALLGIGLALFFVLALRALRTFLLTRRVADLLVLIGVVWLATALIGALLLTPSDLGWWLGHMYELDGMLIVGIPVALDLAHTAQSRPLTGDLHAADLVASEEVFLGSHVRALMLRLAQKDEYTEQHTRRVAMRAVQVGELLGLSPGRLRSLAIGALVHDIGKLSVPDSILKKPGPLDAAEYEQIQRHPELGARLLDELGGFPHGVHQLVRGHHERLDGTGYPSRVTADSINLDTRILTVCDVYDALITSRVYRPAWGHHEAISTLRDKVGSSFDARCVDALEELLEREAVVVNRPGPVKSTLPAALVVPASVWR